jgi:hypothetical protein
MLKNELQNHDEVRVLPNRFLRGDGEGRMALAGETCPLAFAACERAQRSFNGDGCRRRDGVSGALGRGVEPSASLECLAVCEGGR